MTREQRRRFEESWRRLTEAFGQPPALVPKYHPPTEQTRAPEQPADGDEADAPIELDHTEPDPDLQAS